MDTPLSAGIRRPGRHCDWNLNAKLGLRMTGAMDVCEIRFHGSRQSAASLLVYLLALISFRRRTVRYAPLESNP